MVSATKPDLEKLVKQVELNESSLMPMEIRLRLVRDVMGLKVDQPAEYAVITGCRSPSSFYHLAHFGALLNYLGASYTLLSTETCCSESYMRYVDHRDASESAKYEAYARQSTGRNIERIRSLGINKIVTVCAGCMTRYSHIWGGGDMEVLYYTQYLLPRLEGLRLEADIDFYEGCHAHHRTPRYQIDTMTSAELLSRVEGLTITRTIPSYCCRTFADKVFGASHAPVIVTPTSCCAGILGQKRGATSPLVKPLTQLLCEASGIRWALGGKIVKEEK